MLTSPWGNEDLVLRSSSIGSDFRSGIAAKNRSASIVTNVYEPYEEQLNEDLYYRGKSRNRYGRISKNSPTPSIKRGKAERLLREHGSPPGVRVTAGGRIVPDGLSPLNSPGPYFKYPAQLRNQHVSPYPVAVNMAPKLFPGQLFDVGNGMLCQYIDGELRPVGLPAGVIPLPMAPINMNTLPAMNSQAQFGMPMMFPNMAPSVASASASPPNNKTAAENANSPDARTLRIMEDNHTRLQAELKDLDRSEVLQRDLLTPAMRNEIVKQRVSLVNRLDESRCGITEMKRIMNAVTDSFNENATTQMSATHAQYPQNLQQFSFHGTMPQNFVPISLAGFSGSSFTTADHGFPHGQPILAAATTNSTQGEQYPRAQKPQQLSAGPSPLQERSGNAGTGLDGRRDASGHTSAPLIEPVPRHASGNKQESVLLASRRSHAVEIKKPSEATKIKSSLNPASPSYEPVYASAAAINREDTRTSTPGAFMPSPRMIAEMDHLVQSPNQEERSLTNSTAEAAPQPSASSASTADFFPHDTHHHSTTKYSFANRDVKVNLPAWIPTDAQHNKSDLQGTSTRPSTNFRWNDGPDDDQHGATSGFQSVLINEWGRQDGEIVVTTTTNNMPSQCDMDFVTQAAFCQISPATQRRQSAQLRDVNVAAETIPQLSSHIVAGPAPRLFEKPSLRAVSAQNKSPTKTATYWEGFQMGMQQDVLTEIRDEEYCRGYRDGLIHSSTPILQGNSPGAHTMSQQASPSTFSDHFTRDNPGFDGHTMSRTASLPSIAVPTNSLVNSPLQVTSAGHSPFFTQLPATSAGAFSALSSDAWSAAHHQIGTQTSNIPLRVPEPISPSANRNLGYAKIAPHEVRTTRIPSSSMQGPLPNNDLYVQQRLSKGSTSVAPSNKHARGWFPQYDGSGDEVSSESPTNVAIPTSPVMKALAKSSQPPSPVKRTASAAMAKVQQIAGLSGRRDKSSVDTQLDPAKMSSPEKKEWRAKWRRVFENLKDDEQKEIARLRKDHPNA